MPSGAYGTLLDEISSKARGAIVAGWDAIPINPIQIDNATLRAHNIYEYVLNGGLQKDISANFPTEVRNVIVGAQASSKGLNSFFERHL